MIEDIQMRVREIKKLMFSGRYPEMLGSTQTLLAEIAKDPYMDQAQYKKWLVFIFTAMNKQDYLLVADVLSNEILPLYLKGCERNALDGRRK